MDKPRSIRNLALIGFMGTGKTTVGHMVAGLLNHRLVDTDELIENETGRRISEIFAHDGEARFRELESVIVHDLVKLHDAVISTGGGLGGNPEHLERLKEHALTVGLWASPEAIWERVGRQTHRPLLRDAEPLTRIRELLAAREPVYRQADVLINTEMRSMKEVANQVLHQYRLARGDLLNP